MGERPHVGHSKRARSLSNDADSSRIQINELISFHIRPNSTVKFFRVRVLMTSSDYLFHPFIIVIEEMRSICLSRSLIYQFLFICFGCNGVLGWCSSSPIPSGLLYMLVHGIFMQPPRKFFSSFWYTRLNFSADAWWVEVAQDQRLGGGSYCVRQSLTYFAVLWNSFLEIEGDTSPSLTV